MENLLQQIKNASIQEKKSIEQIGLKLTEETGEVAQAILSSSKASGCDYKNLNMNDVKEECADVVLTVLSIFYKCGGNDEELKNKLNAKLGKWKLKSHIK